MFSKCSVFNSIVIMALLMGMGACQPPPANTTKAPSVTPKPIEPTNTPTPTEPVGWVFPENWWLEPQVWAMSPDSSGDADGNPVMNLDYEAYRKAGLTVMSWVDTGESDIQDLHDRGIIVVGDDSMITTYRLPLHPWSEYEGPPELMDAAIRDPYGNIFRDDFQLTDAFGWDVSFIIYSMLHPLWQEHKIEKMKAYIDAGADGYLIDELIFGTTNHPDFNPHTMQLFNTYLLETYSDEELQALGAPWGIEDFSDFDYAALVREHLPADMTVLTIDDWENWDIRGGLPLRREFQRFLMIENQKAAQHIINEGRAYAQETYGRYIPLSVDLPEVTAMLDGSYLYDELDFLESEFPYHKYNNFPGARTTHTNKLTGYFDIPLISMTFMHMRPTIVEWGKENTVNLYRTMIADAVASGGAFHIEINRHEIDQDMDVIGPYYHFLLDNPPLYEEVEPLSGEIGVLILWESIVYASYNDWAFIGLCDLLSDSGYQFSALFGAEEFKDWDDKLPERPAPPFSLKLDELKEFSVIMIPELHYLTDNHAEILMQYVEEGGTLVIFSTQETTWDMDTNDPASGPVLSARGRGVTEIGDGKLIHINGNWGKDFVENPSSGMRAQLIEMLEGQGFQPEVRMSDTSYLAATAYAGEEKMVVHFVNYDLEEGADITTSTGPVDVEITLPDGFQVNNPGLYLFTPGEMPRPLDGVLNGNQLHITLPDVYIWSVLLIGEESIIGEQVAVLPTITPTLIPPTHTPTLSPEQEKSYFIYDDTLAEGWDMWTWNGEADAAVEGVVHRGQMALGVTLDTEGGIGFTNPLDFSEYAYLEFFINGGSQGGQELNIYIWDAENDTEVKFYPLSEYTLLAQLPPDEWFQVRIPLQQLDLENKQISLNIPNASSQPAPQFFLDDIRLISVVE